MPPKRKGKGSSAARKRPKSDWRTPLFYWRGELDGKRWIGSWFVSGRSNLRAFLKSPVASADGLPSDEEFASSANSFELECSKALGFLPTNSSDGNATFSGKYKLDNGDGPQDYSDIDHQIWVVDGPPSGAMGDSAWGLAGACGNTEFGRFVSLGKLE
eukprot:2550276-Prymnesium_polylepis.1